VCIVFACCFYIQDTTIHVVRLRYCLRWLRNVQNRIVYVVYGWVYVKVNYVIPSPKIGSWLF
jgi:hypothetical protein